MPVTPYFITSKAEKRIFSVEQEMKDRRGSHLRQMTLDS
jgi:hypothetical protein